jgi:hypothetical protein
MSEGLRSGAEIPELISSLILEISRRIIQHVDVD